MGRPRLIKTKDGGEISCKNISAEDADKIRAVFEEPQAIDKTLSQLANIAPPTADDTFDDPVVADMPYVSLGTYKDGNSWHVVVIKYDPASGSAEIETDENVGHEKIFAIEKFKILASQYELV